MLEPVDEKPIERVHDGFGGFLNAENLFQTLADTIPHLCWIANPEGYIVWYNRRFVEYTGKTFEQMYGLKWAPVLATETQPKVLEQWLDCVAKGQPFDMEFPIKGTDGSFRPFLTRVEPFKGADGRVQRWFGTNTDIGERYQAETTLRERERTHRIVADNTYDFEFWWAPDGRYLYVSPSCERICGRKPEEFLADPDLLSRLVHPEDRSRFDEHVQALMASPASVEFECRIVHQDGTVRWLANVCQPVYGDGGEYLGLRGSNRDVTDRKRAELTLLDADRRKDQFLAMLAHELRNPLAPIRNSLHLLRVSHDDSDAIGLVREIMERQVDQMVHLIDDLLDVSRISTGKFELSKQVVDLAAVVANAVETAQPVVDAADHQLAISLPAMPIMMDADPRRIAQVIVNLLNNAAKYTKPRGQIWLTVRNDGDEAVISIRDTGVGIAADMLPRVFDMFAQVPATIARAQGGLGIGLTLTKSFVEMHEGRLEARSDGLDLGSEFLVYLPTAGKGHVLPTQPVQARQSSASNRRILIVDDSRSAALVLGKLLEKLGHEVRTAAGAASAIEIARSNWPDLVISDIAMPTIDGYELARRLRKEPGLKNLHLVALSGYGQDTDKQQSKEAGFDCHLVKPVSLEALKDLLASLPAPSLR